MYINSLGSRSSLEMTSADPTLKWSRNVSQSIRSAGVSPLTKWCLGENDRAPRVSHESLQFGKSYSYSGFMRQSRVTYNIDWFITFFFLGIILQWQAGNWPASRLGTESKLIRGDEFFFSVRTAHEDVSTCRFYAINVSLPAETWLPLHSHLKHNLKWWDNRHTLDIPLAKIEWRGEKEYMYTRLKGQKNPSFSWVLHSNEYCF